MTNTPDINALLVRKVKSLAPDTKQQFRNTFSKAPLMLSLFKFAEEQKQEKFRTQDGVFYLYRVKNGSTEYPTAENRFFKLRKKFLDHFQSSPVDTNPVFTPQEAELHEIKSLVVNGKHTESYPRLANLEQRLWKENVFELLPEVLDLMINNNQFRKEIQNNEGLYLRLDLAIALQTDLAEAKKLARQLYDVNFSKGIAATPTLFLKLQRLSINRKAYPRFKLIYNLISATCKLAGGGLEFKPDFKITNRFITVINQIHTLHPNMPDYRFIAGYSDTQNYLFENLKVMNHFNAFHFKDAAILMATLYESVMKADSSMKRIIGPTFFGSASMIFSSGERYSEALKAATDYLNHLRQTKQTEDLLKAYMEIANVHIWMHPAKTGFSDSFVAEKLDDYAKWAKTQEAYSHYFLGYVNWMKIKLLLVTGDYTGAKNVYEASDFSTYFMHPNLNKEVQKTISSLSNTRSERKQLEKQMEVVHTLKFHATLPPDYMNYLFLEKLLLRKLKA